MANAYVYIHRKKSDGEIFYIGIAARKHRATLSAQRNPIWQRINSKHGRTVEITHENVCWEEACSIEKYLISFYGRLCDKSGILANITMGGEGTLGRKMSEEQKEIMSKARKGLSFLTEDGRRRISEGSKKNRGVKKGAQKTERSVEYRAQLSNAAKRRKNTAHSEEWKRIHSERMRGKKNRYTIALWQDGTISEVFETGRLCAEYLGVSPAFICTHADTMRGINGFTFTRVPICSSFYFPIREPQSYAA